MTDGPNRVTAGIPTGGQFAATQRSEADVDLGGPEPQSTGHRDGALSYRSRYATGGAALSSDDVEHKSGESTSPVEEVDEPVAEDGSLSLAEWQRRVDGRLAVPVDDPNPIATGQPAVIYTGGVPMRGQVLAGPYSNPLLTGRTGVYDVLSDGRVHTRSSTIAKHADDFDKAWHIVQDGRIIAGGPSISQERANEIAKERGGVVQQGFPQDQEPQIGGQQ